MKLIGSFRYEGKQAEVWYRENSPTDGFKHIEIIKTEFNPVDGTIEHTEKWRYKVHRRPLDLVKDTIDVERLKKWLVDVISNKLPTPTQLTSLINLSKNPDDVVTQALISVCLSSNCICPLAYSAIGCLMLSPYPIISKRFNSVENLPITQKKCMVLALSRLRQSVTYEEYMEWLKKLEEKYAQDAKLGIYGGEANAE